MAINGNGQISTTWRQRHSFLSKTIPLLVFAALTVLTFFLWTRQRELAPGGFRPGSGMFSEQSFKR
jgi:hypothetical protein